MIKTVVRFEKWNEILEGKTIPMYDKPEQNAWRHWATGLAYANTGQLDKAKAALADMRKDLDDGHVVEGTARHRRAGARGDDCDAQRRQEEGLRAVPQGGGSRSRELYTEPPSYPRPVVEGWANVALSMGDHATADKAYRETLGREPGSGRAYFGLAAALDGEGKAARGARRAREGREGVGAGRQQPAAAAGAQSVNGGAVAADSGLGQGWVAQALLIGLPEDGRDQIAELPGVKSFPSTVAARRPSRSTTAVCSECVISPSPENTESRTRCTRARCSPHRRSGNASRDRPRACDAAYCASHLRRVVLRDRS